MPASETVIEVPVSPFDHTIIPTQPLAIKLVELPSHILVFPAIEGAFGTGFIVMLVEAIALSQLVVDTHLKS